MSEIIIFFICIFLLFILLQKNVYKYLINDCFTESYNASMTKNTGHLENYTEEFNTTPTQQGQFLVADSVGNLSSFGLGAGTTLISDLSGNITTMPTGQFTNDVNTTGKITATGSIIGGNITTSGTVTGGSVTSTGSITGGNIGGGNITASGSINSGNTVNKLGQVYIGNNSWISSLASLNYPVDNDATNFPSAIVNANAPGSDQALMIVGNKSAGGVRKIKMWDRVDVYGDQSINGSLNVTGTTNVGSSGIQPTNKQDWTRINQNGNLGTALYNGASVASDSGFNKGLSVGTFNNKTTNGQLQTTGKTWVNYADGTDLTSTDWATLNIHNKNISTINNGDTHFGYGTNTNDNYIRGTNTIIDTPLTINNSIILGAWKIYTKNGYLVLNYGGHDVNAFQWGGHYYSKQDGGLPPDLGAV